MKKLLTFAFMAGLAAAQTVYTSSTPFTCDATTESQATSIPQNCRGVTYDGTSLREFRSTAWYQILNYAPIAQPIDIYMSHIVTWDELVKPQGCGSSSCVNPGKYALSWSITDANGVVHTGTVSGEWTAKAYRGSWYPVLLSRSLTIDN